MRNIQFKYLLLAVVTEILVAHIHKQLHFFLFLARLLEKVKQGRQTVHRNRWATVSSCLSTKCTCIQRCKNLRFKAFSHISVGFFFLLHIFYLHISHMFTYLYLHILLIYLLPSCLYHLARLFCRTQVI